MKRSITITVLILLMAIGLVSQTGCSGETEETEPAASESNRWLELLSVLPENESTLKAAFLQDNAYLNEKKQQYPQFAEDYSVIRDHPIILGNSPGDYSDEEWKEV